MKLEGTHKLKAPRERVYQVLKDPQVLQRTIPGCESLEKTAADSYLAKIRAGVGTIKGVFTGLIRYSGDVQVGGTIASVGQRMIQGTAKLMASQFFTALEAEARTSESESPPKHGFFRTALRWFSGWLRRAFER